MTAPFDAAMADLPLVAILRGVSPDAVAPIGDVLAAGFRLIEVPLTAPDPFRSIALLVDRLYPTGGIGPDDLDRYVAAGASGFGLGGALYRPGDDAAAVAAKARQFVTQWRAIDRSVAA